MSAIGVYEPVLGCGRRKRRHTKSEVELAGALPLGVMTGATYETREFCLLRKAG
jgi:hypothetical protein